MKDYEELLARRDQIVREIASLGQLRRGSVVDQYVEARLKDGSKTRRGPYPVYSFKKNGKTVSRRLKDPEEAELVREQIQAFRRFQKLSAELVEIGEALSELALADRSAVKKTSRPRSRSRRTAK